MLNLKRILSATVLVAVVVTSSLAVSPVGSWTGKLVMSSLPPLPPSASAEQKKKYQEVVATIRKYRVELSVKSNKTFKLSAPALFTQPAIKAEGTWTQKGNDVMLKTLKENGVATKGKDAEPQKSTLSKDGKTMTIVFPSGPSGSMKIVFNKKKK
jgi:hypothetical protein